MEVDHNVEKKERRLKAALKRIIDAATHNKYGKAEITVTSGHVVDFKWTESYDEFK
jgi:hypothetical protein